MSEVKRLLSRGLQSGLQQQVALLYKVLADPAGGHMSEKEKRFTKGLSNSVEAYNAAAAIIEAFPLPE